jgi:ribosomal protein S11
MVKNIKGVSFKGGQKRTWVARETACKYVVKILKKFCKKTTELQLNILAARKYRRLLWRKLKWVRLTKQLKSIRILNRIPFNGCRLKKRKR